MIKGKSLLGFSLRTILWVLAFEAVTVLLAWLLFRWWYWLKHFSDVLFLVGVLELMAAALGMLGRPYEVSNSPWGVWAPAVHASEQEKRWEAVATLIEQKSFALRMIACGTLTVLLAVILSYRNL